MIRLDKPDKRKPSWFGGLIPGSRPASPSVLNPFLVAGLNGPKTDPNWHSGAAKQLQSERLVRESKIPSELAPHER
jgi:hypothetical protein